MREIKPDCNTVIALSLLVILVLAAHVWGFSLASRLNSELQNSLHAPGFGAIALIVMRSLRTTLDRRSSYVIAAIFTILLGIVGEGLQMLNSRDADLVDIGRNVLGIFSFLGLALVADRKAWQLNKPTIRILVAGVVLIGSVTAIYPAAWNSFALGARAVSVPVLLSFDRAWETKFYEPGSATDILIRPAPEAWPSLDPFIAELVFSPSRSPGIEIKPHPDWSEYRSLRFIVASGDGQPHFVVIRIHDRNHNDMFDDRFNLMIAVEAQPSVITIPLVDIKQAPVGRELVLTEIAEIIVFLADAQGGERILIDEFLLEK